MGNVLHSARLLYIDLEVHPEDNRLLKCAVWRPADEFSQCWQGAFSLAQVSQALLALMDEQTVLVGHHIIGFDWVQLCTYDPAFAAFRQQCIDTLQLNPLAFPKTLTTTL
jgi:hypothetical protein